MSSFEEHVERWRHHKQPPRVDYSRPGFQRPPDPVPDDTEETPDDAA